MLGFLFGLLAANTAAADALPTIPVIAREAPCQLRSMQAICSSSWSQGLHSSHFQQRYRISTAETGARVFEGIGTYRVAADGSVDGVWAGRTATSIRLKAAGAANFC